MTFPGRLEQFRAVDSTQRVVREWLEAGEPEVCVAVADHQTAGRGRQGKEWIAPAGSALLLSAGFRPKGLLPRHAWRLAAIVALAMRDAAEEAAGLPDGTIWLKWPNDLVAADERRGVIKIAGVLGESVSSSRRVQSAVIGIGINGNWKPADFPWLIAATMTSLRQLSGNRPIDHAALLDAFLARLEPRYEALLAGTFDAASWTATQITTGRQVVVEVGGEKILGRATGVDPDSGALFLAPDKKTVLTIDSGEVTRCRIT
ncbi:MAG: BirA family transcriptional regulator [Chloroflexota bacterium]|jgi:BirA family biotin operon repressor/biotin-[acetyl-CoA-carboxylase] ligase|nr:BirA family transcriptional regulator [Chloroflexota bacterium]